MAPPLKPFTEDQRATLGFGSMTAFFDPKPKPGRPPGTVKTKPGPRPTAVPTPPQLPAVPKPVAVPPRDSKNQKRDGGGPQRVNWAIGEPLVRLTKALHEWLTYTNYLAIL